MWLPALMFLKMITRARLTSEFRSFGRCQHYLSTSGAHPRTVHLTLSLPLTSSHHLKKKKFPTKEVSLRQSVFALLYSKCRSHTPVCKASRSSSQTHLGSFWWSWTSSQSCALSLKVLTAADTIYEEYFKSVPAYLHTLFSDKPQVKWSWLVHF